MSRRRLPGLSGARPKALNRQLDAPTRVRSRLMVKHHSLSFLKTILFPSVTTIFEADRTLTVCMTRAWMGWRAAR